MECSYTVLAVDDDEHVRQFLQRTITRLGYDVCATDRASTALDILNAMPVDVVISDVRMPDKDGIWLVDRMRERFPHVPAILATGVRHMDYSFTLRPGVVAYIVKPIDLGELAFALKTGVAWHQTVAAQPSEFFVHVCP